MSYETALWPLQQAVFQRLSSDPVLSGMITGVFDSVEEDQAYPYVVIGEPNQVPFDTKNTFGEEISIVIHVWSNYAGKKEAYNILSACLKALSYKLDIQDFELLKVEKRGMTVFDDINPDIKHGVLRMRYTIKN
ncbi:DUF3168 domain-containing protein [Pseudobacillus sp. 179-B 2D1 NHS]|uniref:DUF3168 domain-containing protein n=1 Tax=Pseudobacillus sp. 179-B 2D1 NHS TaxID=3374292 RepID=UPI00387978A1